MATTNIAYDSEILASTLNHSNKEVKDGLYQSSEVLDYVKRMNGEVSYDGGDQIISSIDLVEHGTGTRFDNQPYAIRNATVRSNIRPPVFQSCRGDYTVALSGMERQKNSGKAKIYDLWDKKMANVTAMAMRHYQQFLLAGLSPVNSGGVFGGWGTINGEDVATGFLERAAVGSQDNVVGGLSKATYAAVAGWQNQVFNFANLFGTNGVTGMFSLRTRAKNRSPWGTDGMVWVLSEAARINLKRSIQQQEWYVKDLDAGRQVEMFAGLEIIESTFMPVSTATGGATTNTYPFSVWLWQAHGIYPMFYKGEAGDGFFGVGEIKDGDNQDLTHCEVLCAGTNCCDHLGSQGLGYAGESY